eukprot:gene20985-23038_t
MAADQDGEQKFCKLCLLTIEKKYDWNLIIGKYNYQEEIDDLPFNLSNINSSKLVCHGCLNLLKKRRGHINKVKQTELELKNKIRNSRKQSPSMTSTISPLFQPNRQVFLTSTPKAKNLDTAPKAKEKISSSRSTPTSTRTLNFSSFCVDDQPKKIATAVSVKVKWPSKTLERNLPTQLVSLGTMICRGTYQQIAHAAWRNDSIRPGLIKLFLKEIDKECGNICAKGSKAKKGQPLPTPAGSVLRKTGKDEILNFSFESIKDELLQKCPLLYNVLKVAALSHAKSPSSNAHLVSTVCMAASVCLKNRSPKMTSLQLLISIIMQHSGVMGRLMRLKPLRLVVSHTFLLKKLDEFGKDHDGFLRNQEFVPCLGRKIVIDNFDFRTNVHNMSETHQNADEHWVAMASVDHRIVSELSTTRPPLSKLLSLENSTYLPSKHDHKMQEENYIHIFGRTACRNIKNLNALFEDVTIKRIKHQYSSEARKPTNTVSKLLLHIPTIKLLDHMFADLAKTHSANSVNVPKLAVTFLGFVYENSNESSGMQKVLNQLQSNYVATLESDDDSVDKHYSRIPIVGDQGSVERGVNVLLQLSNGFNEEERLDGLHMEIADFHAGMKFLQLGFDEFYQPKATMDKCTLYTDRVLVNRRNVVTDVSKRFDANKQFFLTSVNARIIAAFLDHLGMKDMDDEIPENLIKEVESLSKHEKRKFFHALCTDVVSKFLLQPERDAGIFEKQSYEDWLQNVNPKTADGRFMCRFKGCEQTFQCNGKRRLEHEKKAHGLHVFATKLRDAAKKEDDMLNYQLALLNYGMIVSMLCCHRTKLIASYGTDFIRGL